jgi:hypothetical protein
VPALEQFASGKPQMCLDSTATSVRIMAAVWQEHHYRLRKDVAVSAKGSITPWRATKTLGMRGLLPAKHHGCEINFDALGVKRLGTQITVDGRGDGFRFSANQKNAWVGTLVADAEAGEAHLFAD